MTISDYVHSREGQEWTSGDTEYVDHELQAIMRRASVCLREMAEIRSQLQMPLITLRGPLKTIMDREDSASPAADRPSEDVRGTLDSPMAPEARTRVTCHEGGPHSYMHSHCIYCGMDAPRRKP